MIGAHLNKRVRRVLAVTPGADMGLDLDDTPSAFFPAGLMAPEGDNGLLDSAPRTTLSVWRFYWKAGPSLRPGDHVEVPGDTTYELLSVPKTLGEGRRTVGYSAPALPVGVLYPRAGALHALGDDTVIATVPCSVYSQLGRDAQRGEYHSAFAEAPAASWAGVSAQKNLELRFGDEVWKITDANLSRELPYVAMNLQRAG